MTFGDQELPLRPLAAIENYDELHAALRQRWIEVGTTLASVDEISGVPDGWSAKVLGLGRAKNCGLGSVWLLAAALGCKFVLVADPVLEAKMRRRWVPRGWYGHLASAADPRPRGPAPRSDGWAALRGRKSA